MTVSRSFVLLAAALVCAVIALVVALGGGVDGTWADWISGSLVAYLGSLFP